MSPITTHVLDTALGRPAVGLRLRLEMQVDGAWHTLASRTTDRDGRVIDLLEEGSIAPGLYRIAFDTEAYLKATGRPVFYPVVEIAFRIEAASEHYHIPLLLSPFGYSTYRGS